MPLKHVTSTLSHDYPHHVYVNVFFFQFEKKDTFKCFVLQNLNSNMFNGLLKFKYQSIHFFC